MFIKHGDGKIVGVLQSEEELTEDQKKSVKAKKATQETTDDSQVEKKSGR